MKKISIFIVTLFFVVLGFFSVVNVNASVETTTAISTTGAQVRTVSPNGIRFVTEVDFDLLNSEYTITKENVVTYGTLIGYGTSTTEELLKDGQYNAKTIVDLQATSLYDEANNLFAGSIIDIPESAFTQKMTARGYVVTTDGAVIYGTTTVVRSIYEVSKAAQQTAGYESNSFIEDVIAKSEYTVTFELNNGSLITDEKYTKYYPTPKQSLTIGRFGIDGYFTTAINTVNAFLITKGQFAAQDNAFSYARRLGFTYNTAIGEYVVDQFLPGNNTVNILDSNTSDAYLVCSSNYKSAYDALATIPVGSVVKLNTNINNLAVGVIDVNVDIHENYVPKYTISYELGTTANAFPTISKPGYEFAGWKDANGDIVTTVNSTCTLTAEFTSVFEAFYVLNGGTMEGVFDTRYSVTPAESTLPFNNGGYFSNLTHICYYNKEDSKGSTWQYAYKIGLNYDQEKGAYVVNQKLAAGIELIDDVAETEETAAKPSNRLSDHYLIINTANCPTGLSWATGLEIGQYIIFSTDLSTTSKTDVNVLVFPATGYETYKVAGAEGTFTLPIPTKEGLVFDGWYTTSDFTGEKVTSYTVGEEQNKVFYAKWITA